MTGTARFHRSRMGRSWPLDGAGLGRAAFVTSVVFMFILLPLVYFVPGGRPVSHVNAYGFTPTVGPYGYTLPNDTNSWGVSVGQATAGSGRAVHAVWYSTNANGTAVPIVWLLENGFDHRVYGSSAGIAGNVTFTVDGKSTPFLDVEYDAGRYGYALPTLHVWFFWNATGYGAWPWS